MQDTEVWDIQLNAGVISCSLCLNRTNQFCSIPDSDEKLGNSLSITLYFLKKSENKNSPCAYNYIILQQIYKN